MSMKELRTSAEDMLKAGITNKAALVEALPVIMKLKSATERAAATVKACRKLVEDLSEDCGRYGIDHPSIFDEGLQESAIGVKAGDLTIDDITYHFTNGFDAPKRTDGGTLSQAFLAGLPREWVKSTLKLDTTGINRIGTTDEALLEQGLHRPDTYDWSV